MTATHREVLQQFWGYPSFRPLQEDIITSVLDGKDTLALMPTGGGKSLCFQVPALCRAGVCLVISPLIALMKDQVGILRRKGIAAAAIYSGMPVREIDRIFDMALAGQLKFLYLSPERLHTRQTAERIRNMTVNLLAVDEAHCISQWGYDFRPSYLRIADIRAELPGTPVLALTATATTEVVRDIQRRLLFREGKVLQKSFSRQNLAYVVLQEENKWPRMLDILRKVPGSAVVYVRNRRMTAEAARYLQQNNISAEHYHAGLDTAERSRRQDAWIRNDIRVIVSTNAFGMGIDKPDVRLVIHLDLPDSLEAYFQEAGRAGRDGQQAYAVLLVSPADRLRLEEGIETAYPSLSEVRQVYRALGSFLQLAQGAGYLQTHDFDLNLFCRNFQLHPLKSHAALRLLEQEGWIALTESVQVPSAFHISVDRESLYDYQLKNPRLDPLIKTVLRLTQGAFQDFVRLNEYQVARVLQTGADKVIAGLRFLAKEGLIQYQPTKDKPQLVFLRPRVDAEELQFDQVAYAERRERSRVRILAAVDYATTPLCRSRQLLSYFGEKDAPVCGICDVCLDNKRKELTNNSFEGYRKRILTLLASGACRNEKDLTSHFPANLHRLVLETVQYLLDEGQLERQSNGLTLIAPEAGKPSAPTGG